MEIKHIGIAIDGSLLGNTISAIARKYKIPTLSVESFYVNENIERLFLYKADKICIYGEQGKNALLSIGYDENRIVLTGNPRYDKLDKLDPKESRKMLQSHGINKEKKLIVIAMSRWHNADEVWMSSFIKFCNKNNFEIIIKIHPMYKTRWIDDSRNKIDSISKSCRDLKYHITHDLNSTDLITGSDIVITDYSNIGIEAILLDKIVITTNFTHESLENTPQYHKCNASIHVENYSNLEEIVLNALSKDQINKPSDGKNKIIQLYNYYNDSKAAERIYQILTK